MIKGIHPQRDRLSERGIKYLGEHITYDGVRLQVHYKGVYISNIMPTLEEAVTVAIQIADQIDMKYAKVKEREE